MKSLKCVYISTMIKFDDIDARLESLGLARQWLAEATGRSPNSIRVALAPNASPSNRSPLLQRSLTEAILKEENGRNRHVIINLDEEDEIILQAAANESGYTLPDYMCQAAVRYAEAELNKNHRL